jgi:hypothetical protein
MENNLEHRIRERAYTLWCENGQIDGQADQHWLTAERELLATLTANLPPAKTTAAKASATKARKPRSRATPTPAKAMARAG